MKKMTWLFINNSWDFIFLSMLTTENTVMRNNVKNKKLKNKRKKTNK